MQIPSQASTHKNEKVQYQIDTPNLDFETAKNQVKRWVTDTYGNAMILSWKDGTTGKFYPTFECGDGKKDVPPWIYYCPGKGS